MSGSAASVNRSLRTEGHPPSGPIAWSSLRDTLVRFQPHLALPQTRISTFGLTCHVPVVPGDGMIDAISGGMFLYHYRVPDPTSELTSAAMVTEAGGLDILLRQPAGRLLVAEYTLTCITERGARVDARFSVMGYTDERVLTEVTIPLASTRVDPPLRQHFLVDRILPNSTHQVVGVPSSDSERWITIATTVSTTCIVFVSEVTVHIA